MSSRTTRLSTAKNNMSEELGEKEKKSTKESNSSKLWAPIIEEVEEDIDNYSVDT